MAKFGGANAFGEEEPEWSAATLRTVIPQWIPDELVEVMFEHGEEGLDLDKGKYGGEGPSHCSQALEALAKKWHIIGSFSGEDAITLLPRRDSPTDHSPTVETTYAIVLPYEYLNGGSKPWKNIPAEARKGVLEALRDGGEGRLIDKGRPRSTSQMDQRIYQENLLRYSKGLTKYGFTKNDWESQVEALTSLKGKPGVVQLQETTLLPIVNHGDHEGNPGITAVLRALKVQYGWSEGAVDPASVQYEPVVDVEGVPVYDVFQREMYFPQSDSILFNLHDLVDEKGRRTDEYSRAARFDLEIITDVLEGLSSSLEAGIFPYGLSVPYSPDGLLDPFLQQEKRGEKSIVRGVVSEFKHACLVSKAPTNGNASWNIFKMPANDSWLGVCAVQNLAESERELVHVLVLKSFILRGRESSFGNRINGSGTNDLFARIMRPRIPRANYLGHFPAPTPNLIHLGSNVAELCKGTDRDVRSECKVDGLSVDKHAELFALIDELMDLRDGKKQIGVREAAKRMQALFPVEERPGRAFSSGKSRRGCCCTCCGEAK